MQRQIQSNTRVLGSRELPVQNRTQHDNSIADEVWATLKQLVTKVLTAVIEQTLKKLLLSVYHNRKSECVYCPVFYNIVEQIHIGPPPKRHYSKEFGTRISTTLNT